MTSVEFDIQPVPADELLDAWEELGYEKPAKELWPPAVEKGTNTVLVARDVGGVAVGSVDLMWRGPTKHDVTFRKAMNQLYWYRHLYSRKRIPAIYGLFVREEFREQGAGTGLMLGAEQQIIQRPKSPNIVALTVESDNDNALALYEKLEYAKRKNIKNKVPVWNAETEQFEPVDTQSWVMTKNLSVK